MKNTHQATFESSSLLPRPACIIFLLHTSSQNTNKQPAGPRQKESKRKTSNDGHGKNLLPRHHANSIEFQYPLTDTKKKKRQARVNARHVIELCVVEAQEKESFDSNNLLVGKIIERHFSRHALLDTHLHTYALQTFSQHFGANQPRDGHKRNNKHQCRSKSARYHIHSHSHSFSSSFASSFTFSFLLSRY